MKQEDSQALALELMGKHGLLAKGWTFHFDNAKRRFGYCQYRPKMISISKHLSELNSEEQVKDTILHEIAHALAGPRAHHYAKWRYQAMVVGAKPERCYSADVVQPPHKWTGTCPNGHVTKRMKRMKISCGRCQPTWNPELMFTWTENA
jgi:predicted SprT family Zn-dependent metalloprotease